MFFSELAWRKHPGSGRDDQGTIRAGERGAERLDRAPIRLTVNLEFREVVNEGRVDHAVGGGRSAAQAREIIERTAMHIGSLPSSPRSPGSPPQPAERKDLLTTRAHRDEALKWK